MSIDLRRPATFNEIQLSYAMTSDPADDISVTERAAALIDELTTTFGSLIFVQSGRCCDGSDPMCFPEGEFLLGPGDLVLGEVAVCPSSMDQDLYGRWGKPRLLIECASGSGDSVSIEGSCGMHFIARTQSTVVTRRSTVLLLGTDRNRAT